MGVRFKLRNMRIGPEFFRDDRIADLCPAARLLFVGMAMGSDSKWLVPDRPKMLVAFILPFDDGLDPDALVDEMVSAGAVMRATGRNGDRSLLIHLREHFRKESAAIRAAALMAVGRDLTAAQWSTILAMFAGRCAYCGRRGRKLTLDHLQPVSRGGAHTASNAVPACGKCNSSKGARMPLEFFFGVSIPRKACWK